MIKEKEKYIAWFKNISLKDVPLVGGKNASLGEMYSNLSKKGINVPNGFALTSKAYWHYLKENKINKEIENIFSGFSGKEVKSLQAAGRKARSLILKGDFPQDLEKDILENYIKLSKQYGTKEIDVAVRSSATAEDLAGASFAGQYETYLNIRGGKALLRTAKKCMASLFTDRAIAYREEKGFKHSEIALSVCVQKMVKSDSSGVMFTLDTETGFDKVVLINSIFGVGEMIVQGKITPDEFYVFKPTLLKGFKSIIVKDLGHKNKKYVYGDKGGLKQVSVSDQDKLSLNDKEVLTLAKWALIIEDHYGSPQDIEWAKDKQGLFIVQSRPETIHAGVKKLYYEEYIVGKAKPILTGIAIGDKIGTGKARVISNVSNISQFQEGEVLVTKMTDPDWLPIMRIASALITDEGGKTAHAAIISRELGIPCIVGLKKASSLLKTGQTLTIDCSQGFNGKVYLGKVPFKVKRHNLEKIPKTKTKVMVNIGAPEIAFKSSFLPNQGVGLAREEFIIADKIKIHPLALFHYSSLKDKKLKVKIDKITRGYKDKKEYFIDKLAEGVSQIAAAFYPQKVIVRFSDFKTNEYKNLIGGELFEQEESNPMLGFRGASRYLDNKFQPAFEMECQAVKKAIEVFGLDNIWVMIPFCRTLEEGKEVKKLLAKNKIKTKVIVMCELPANVVLAEEFLEIFDGMSIGSNDLTQFVLGLDRDNAHIAHIGDERNKAVKKMIKSVIALCRKKKKYCGICGEAASLPDFTKFLVECGIESISVNPGSIIKTILTVASKEKNV